MKLEFCIIALFVAIGSVFAAPAPVPAVGVLGSMGGECVLLLLSSFADSCRCLQLFF